MKVSDKFRKSYRPPTQEVGQSVGMGLFDGVEYAVTFNMSHATLGFFGVAMTPDEADEMSANLKRYAALCRAHANKREDSK